MADYGFRTRFEDGSVDLTTTDRITRRMGSLTINVNQTSGFFDIPYPAASYFYYISAGGDNYSGSARPELSIAGNRISWSYGSLPVVYRRALSIVYGGY